KPGLRSRSSGGYPVTASSGKRARSAPWSRDSASRERIRSRLPSRSPTTVSICARASLITFSPLRRKLADLSPLQPNRVQVALADLVGARDQILDVVVLCVEVASRERIGSSRDEHAHEARRELGRCPRRVVRRPRRHPRLHEARRED